MKEILQKYVIFLGSGQKNETQQCSKHDDVEHTQVVIDIVDREVECIIHWAECHRKWILLRLELLNNAVSWIVHFGWCWSFLWFIPLKSRSWCVTLSMFMRKIKGHSNHAWNKYGSANDMRLLDIEVECFGRNDVFVPHWTSTMNEVSVFEIFVLM